VKQIKASLTKISVERKEDQDEIAKVQNKLNEILSKLDEHIAKDVPFVSVLKDKWAYVSFAAAGYILWQIFTMYADKAVVRVDTLINPPARSMSVEAQEK
jgi:hypothetical protein